MFYALAKSLRRVIIFYFAIMPFFLGMIITLHFSTGMLVDETSTLTLAAFSVYRFINGVANTQEYVTLQPVFYYTWSYFLVMFYFYLVYPVSIAILLESYEETVMELGHITDNSARLSDSNILEWVKNFLPWSKLQDEQNLLKELKEKEERIQLLGEDRLQAFEASSDSENEDNREDDH